MKCSLPRIDAHRGESVLIKSTVAHKTMRTIHHLRYRSLVPTTLGPWPFCKQVPRVPLRVEQVASLCGAFRNELVHRPTSHFAVPPSVLI